MRENIPHPEKDGKQAIKVFGEHIKELYDRAQKKDYSLPPRPADTSGEPMSEEQYETLYREACLSIGTEILPENLLKDILTYLEKNRFNIKKLLWPNFSLCVAVIPTSEVGNKLTPKQVSEHGYMQSMLVDHEEMTHNLTLNVGRYVSAIPERIRQKCTMQLAYADPNERTWPTDEEFKAICNFYIDAFNEIRLFMGFPEINKEQFQSK
jgi:hypothetical protein